MYNRNKRKYPFLFQLILIMPNGKITITLPPNMLVNKGFFIMGKPAALILILILALAQAAFPQTNNAATEMIREIVNEKSHEAGEFANANRLYHFRAGGADSFVEKQVSMEPVSESEVHAAINPADSGNIVMSPIQLTLKTGYFETLVPIYYTRDFGETWRRSDFNPRYPDTNYIIRGGGDPVFAFDADGKLYFSWIHLNKKGPDNDTILWSMMWAWSGDGGENWTFPEDPFIENSAGTFPYNFNIISDKEWLACDQSYSPYRNNLYIAYFLVDATKNTQSIVVKTKPADSARFNPESVIVGGGGSNKIQFAGIAVDSNGVVHVSYFYNNNSLYESRSYDGGKTFTDPNMITYMHRPLNIRGISSSRIYPSPYSTVDPSDPNYVYITYTADGKFATEKTRSDIYFCRSTDGGDNWDEPIIVHNTSLSDPRDQFYSTIYVNPQGVVTVCWYDAKHSEHMVTNDMVHYYMAHSFDNGATFTFPTKVSYQPTDFGTVGNKNNSFGIGEYTQVVSTAGYAIPFWTDGRTNDGDLNIYMAKIPISRYSAIPEVMPVTGKFSLKSVCYSKREQKIIVKSNIASDEAVAFELFSVDGKLLQKFNPAKPDGEGTFRLQPDKPYTGLCMLRASLGSTYQTKKVLLTK